MNLTEIVIISFKGRVMNKITITIIALAFLMGFGRAQAESPPWGGDEHYTFGDEDPFFVHGEIYETASVDIIGGSFADLHCWDYSKVYMYAGTGDFIFGNEFSKINLYGGTLNNLGSYDNSEITLFVENYNIELDPFIGYDARLTGSWFYDPGTFDILVRDGSLSHVTVEIVPEPSTLAIFALGALVLLKNQKR